MSMPTTPALQASHQPSMPDTSHPGKRPWWRSLVLFLLLLLSIALYAVLIKAAPPRDDLITPFLYVWMICFVPYFVGCAFVLATKPKSGYWSWIELGIILLGALIFRAMLLPLPPGLSHDAWRYLWDARVTLHGYSPYTTTPKDPVFLPLRDDLILGHSDFRDAPTIYPPGAQAVYIVSYLLAPSNLFFLKGIFIGFDMLTCVALVVLLLRKGLDPRRVIIYAWCPLPIVEFAIQGHVDVVALTFTVLAVLCATSTRWGSRVLTGFLIGMATLTKIYPLFLLIVIMRRRDWALLATCAGTIILAYIPYLILGHGHVFGYFSKYASEQGGNAGVIQLLVYSLSSGLPLATIIRLEYIVDVVVVCIMSLAILLLRLFKSISMEGATMVFIGTVFAVSSHVFPWYATALLPWVVILVGPLWTRRALSGKGLVVAMAWYFPCVSLFGYFFNNTQDWHVYYQFVYGVVIVGLGVALVVGLWAQLKRLYRLTLEGKPYGSAKHN